MKKDEKIVAVISCSFVVVFAVMVFSSIGAKIEVTPRQAIVTLQQGLMIGRGKVVKGDLIIPEGRNLSLCDFIGVEFQGNLILDGATVYQGLSLFNTKIKGNLSLKGIRFDRNLYLKGCEIGGKIYTDDPYVARLFELAKQGIYIPLNELRKGVL